MSRPGLRALRQQMRSKTDPKKPMSLREMADRCDVSESFLSRLERNELGAASVDTELLQRVSKGYGVRRIAR